MNAREELEYLHHRTPPLAPHGSRSISGVFPPPATREADLRENGWLLTCTTQHIPLPPRGHGFWFGFHAQRWASPHAPLSLADACLVSPRIPLSAEKLRAPVSLIQRSDSASLCVPVGGRGPVDFKRRYGNRRCVPAGTGGRPRSTRKIFPLPPHHCYGRGLRPRGASAVVLGTLPDWTLSLTGFFPTTCFPDERAQRRRKRIQ